MSLRILTERESIAPDLDALVLPADDGPLFPLIIVVVTALEEAEEIGERAESEMRACVLEIRTHTLSYWEQGRMPPGTFLRAPDDAMGAALGVAEMSERFTKRSRTRAISCTRTIPPAMRRLRHAIDAMPAGDEREAAEKLFEQLVALAVRCGIDDDQRTAPRLLGGVFPTLSVGERDERPAEPDATLSVGERDERPAEPDATLETKPEHAAFDGMPFDGGIYS